MGLVLQRCENQSTASGWLCSTEIQAENGLEGEASSNSNNAHDSSQVGPSSDISSFSSPSFILLVEEKSQFRTEGVVWMHTACTLASPEHLVWVGQDGHPLHYSHHNTKRRTLGT